MIIKAQAIKPAAAIKNKTGGIPLIFGLKGAARHTKPTAAHANDITIPGSINLFISAGFRGDLIVFS